LNEQPIYIDESIGRVIHMHQAILDRRLEYPSIFEELNAYANNLYDHFRQGNRTSTVEVSNYHPDFIGKRPAQIINSEIGLEDFQLVIAREYGFKYWKQVEDLKTTPLNIPFEKCVDDLLSGDLVLLKATLVQNPDLMKMRSQYGHQAGLIHYLGSNGVELWRQVVPQNLVRLLKLLIDFNVDTSMQANIYGSNNLLGLLTSSGHPWKAGVARDAIGILREE